MVDGDIFYKHPRCGFICEHCPEFEEVEYTFQRRRIKMNEKLEKKRDELVLSYINEQKVICKLQGFSKRVTSPRQAYQQGFNACYAELTPLIEALRFYAYAGIGCDSECELSSWVSKEGGGRARAALNKIGINQGD